MAFDELKRQHAAGEIHVGVNTVSFNHRNSPFHHAWKHALPAFLLFLAGAAYAFIYGWTSGVIGLLCAALLFISFVRRCIMTRIRKRLLAFAFQNIHNWNTLWREAEAVSLVKHDQAAFPPDDSGGIWCFQTSRPP